MMLDRKKLLENAIAANACPAAIRWAEENPEWTPEQVAEYAPDWYIWACGYIEDWPIDLMLYFVCFSGEL